LQSGWKNHSMKKLYIKFLKSIGARKRNKPVQLNQYHYAKVMKIHRRAKAGEAWDF